MQPTFSRRLIEILERLDATQGEALDRVAERAADAILGGGLLHLFGSGHSVLPTQDAFPRYGSFVGLNPLTDPRLMWHNVLGPGGVRELLWLERTEGYVEQFLAHEPLAAGDVLVVFSHGGRNAAPVEAAMHGRARGLFTVAVTSSESATRPVEHSSGKRLGDVCDVTIDTGVPVEDALITVDGWDRPVGGSSTIVAMVCTQELVARTAAAVARRGQSLPTFVSPTVAGATVSSNDEVFEAHRVRLQAAVARGARVADARTT
jgi:uncharacterized phosphosugar-binding protein